MIYNQYRVHFKAFFFLWNCEESTGEGRGGEGRERGRRERDGKGRERRTGKKERGGGEIRGTGGRLVGIKLCYDSKVSTPLNSTT